MERVIDIIMKEYPTIKKIDIDIGGSKQSHGYITLENEHNRYTIFNYFSLLNILEVEKGCVKRSIMVYHINEINDILMKKILDTIGERISMLYNFNLELKRKKIVSKLNLLTNKAKKN